MVRARRKIVAALKEQNATSAATAAGVLHVDGFDRRALGRLIRCGAVIEGTPDRYYLDETALASLVAHERRFRASALTVAGILALALVGFILWETTR